jgi:hypothetical protein
MGRDPAADIPRPGFSVCEFRRGAPYILRIARPPNSPAISRIRKITTKM